MAAQVVGLNSTFNYQRQVVNELAIDVDVLKQSAFSTSTSGVYTGSNVGIGTIDPTSKLTVEGNASISGILTSTGGFTSDINSLPVKISLQGANLVLSVVGIGTTTLALF